jgi:CRP-like cAMP-binding protein
MVASTALAAPYPLVEHLVRSSERARRVIDRFFRARFDATLQLSACGASHPILQRAARLILELTRSSGRDELGITHETLAAMLGTRRASITVALAALTTAGALATMRASLVVRDRAALERHACSCYTAIANIYAAVGLGYEGEQTATFPRARAELRFG